jgi:hypothetical protein
MKCLTMVVSEVFKWHSLFLAYNIGIGLVDNVFRDIAQVHCPLK